MTLKMKTETIFKVNYFDLNEFVNEFYGFEAKSPYHGSNYKEFPYNFVAVEESGNDVSHEFELTGNNGEMEDEEIQEWVESGGTAWIGNYTILDDLVKRGAIPAGHYVVAVSW